MIQIVEDLCKTLIDTSSSLIYRIDFLAATLLREFVTEGPLRCCESSWPKAGRVWACARPRQSAWQLSRCLLLLAVVYIKTLSNINLHQFANPRLDQTLCLLKVGVSNRS